jgi:hypothetical protein
VFPQVAKHRHIARLSTGEIVRHRYARQLDDAALDGVHQREVAHGPGKKGALGVAGTAQEEGRGGQVENTRQAELAIDRFKTGNPQAGGFVVLFGFLLLIAFQVFASSACSGFSR